MDAHQQAKNTYNDAVDSLDTYWKGVTTTCAREGREPNASENSRFDALERTAELHKGPVEEGHAVALRQAEVESHRECQTSRVSKFDRQLDLFFLGRRHGLRATYLPPSKALGERLSSLSA